MSTSPATSATTAETGTSNGGSEVRTVPRAPRWKPDGEQRAERRPHDDRRQGLVQQQAARAARPTPAQPGDGDLAAPLVRGGDEDQPQDTDEQQPHLGHQERHGDRGLGTHPASSAMADSSLRTVTVSEAWLAAAPRPWGTAPAR